MTKDIYCQVKIEEKDWSSDDTKNSNKLETIIIEIYSYSLELNDIKEFVERIKNNYLNNLHDYRKNKLFIYDYEGLNRDDDYSLDNWSECQFSSTRNFNNLYFDDDLTTNIFIKSILRLEMKNNFFKMHT